MPRTPGKSEILLVNQYFWPDVAATAQLLTDLAESLGEAGHDVSVLAGRAPYAENGNKLPNRQVHKGIAIERVRGSHFGRQTSVGRMLNYLSFLFLALLRLLIRPRPNLIICLSTPPLVAVLGLLAKWRGCRFVYKVEDLYPDVAVALGALGERSLVTNVLSRVSRRTLAGADAVVVLDGTMAKRVSSSAQNRVEVIPNWADGCAIKPIEGLDESFREDHALGDALVLLYSGNMGLAHDFRAVCRAAFELEGTGPGQPQVRFLFVGGGAQRGAMLEEVGALSNVLFLDYQPRDAINAVYNAADIHLVTLKESVEGLLWPSKYPAALAAGKPVLFVGPQEHGIATEIETRSVGWALPNDSEAVAKTLQLAAKDRTHLLEQGKRARELFESKYSRNRTASAWLKLIESLL